MAAPDKMQQQQQSAPPPPPKEVPDLVFDGRTRKEYRRGKFLGKGGFARCYELVDGDTNLVYAGKVVSKTMLQRKSQRDKMAQEVQIHRKLNHPNIVQFHANFEDEDNVYILLELCRKRSLMELHKRRRAVTEPEARYFVYQIVEACIYLHEHRVIHRDLKLGNLFLNDEMQVKIGDFGLATELDFDGERKRTLCGTPNYIAPEMLRKSGHSYEVDIWAIGCVLFTLLVGKPPFETSSLKETYNRIKRNEYHIPSKISPAARQLITRMLQPDPHSRPTIQQVLKFDFFTCGFLPIRLPASCLTTAPKFTTPNGSMMLNAPEARRPFGDSTNQNPALPDGLYPIGVGQLRAVPENQVLPERSVPSSTDDDDIIKKDYGLSKLYSLLHKVIQSTPAERLAVREDEAEDPKATPIFWISKWVDYSDKYGIGYQLCDNSVGVLFNDRTKLVLNKDGNQIQYIDRSRGNDRDVESFYTMQSFPESLKKKITLLEYFRSYMNEHLLKAGANAERQEGDDLARLPYLRAWFRTRSAIVLHLSNGTLQINFFQDHTKVVLCPLMQAVTYIDENKDVKTYPFSSIETYGCTKELASRIRYARNMVERLIAQVSTSRSGGALKSSGSSSGAPFRAAGAMAPQSQNGPMPMQID